MKVSIIIPVYNERTLITRVLESVERADTSPFAKEIIVVEDGSTDGTGELLDVCTCGRDITAIFHKENRGKAAAIRSGLRTASGDIVLIQDADLEYSTHEYRKLLAPFRSSSARVVYGSRFMNMRWPKGMKTANWLANRLFTFLVNLLYKADITDEGTAYKLFRRDLLNSIAIESSGFEFCPEVTAKILKKGIPITEVAISYQARNKKEGKKPGISDGIKIVMTLLKYRFRE